jgi:hypothetical protein
MAGSKALARTTPVTGRQDTEECLVVRWIRSQRARTNLSLELTLGTLLVVSGAAVSKKSGSLRNNAGE